MSTERIIYCDGPDCGGEGGLSGGHTSSNVTTATPPPYVPGGFIEARQTFPGADEDVVHFCSWDCAMKYAAAQPAPERIEIDPPE